MSLYDIKGGSGTKYTLIPEDTHVAKLYSVVSVGEHANAKFLDEKTGKPKVSSQVILTFEFQDVRLEDGRPQALSNTYTASKGKKANLHDVLVALLGGDTAAQELVDSDDTNLGELLEKSVGKAVYITIAHNKGYANIQSIARLPSTVLKTISPVENALVFVPDPENIDQDTLSKLPEFIRKKISSRINNNKINISGSPF